MKFKGKGNDEYVLEVTKYKLEHLKAILFDILVPAYNVH
jgi:hypothetical protein